MIKLAKYSRQIENYEQAIAYRNQALAINSRLPGPRQQIGEVLLNPGRPEEAIGLLSGFAYAMTGTVQATMGAAR